MLQSYSCVKTLTTDFFQRGLGSALGLYVILYGSSQEISLTLWKKKTLSILL